MTDVRENALQYLDVSMIFVDGPIFGDAPLVSVKVMPNNQDTDLISNTELNRVVLLFPFSTYALIS